VNDLLTAQAVVLPASPKKPARVLEDAALADVFGIELAVADAPAEPAPKKRRSAAQATATKALLATPDTPAPAKRAQKAVAAKTAAPVVKKVVAKKAAAKKVGARKAVAQKTTASRGVS